MPKPEPQHLGTAQQLLQRLSSEKAEDNQEIHTYHCTLVTPMYGGGVKPGEVDKDMPIRATAIRGQLRFWWRHLASQLLENGKNLSSKQLFEREREIWGGLGTEKTLGASQVSIRVLQSKARTMIDSTSIIKDDKFIKYAFGAAVNNGDAKWLKEGFEWTIIVKAPTNLWSEVEQALRWWKSFGGLGARTRRGFGSVCLTETTTGAKIPVPTVTSEEAKLAKVRLVRADSEAKSAFDAWQKANRSMFLFRQGEKGRNPGHNDRPGRSYWPEPDAIRRLTQTHAKNHPPEHPAGNVFPRAAFGLPILFEIRGSGEPQPTELTPVGKERMASPLILKPYYDGKWHAAALCFPTKQVWAMAIELKPKNGGIRHGGGELPHTMPSGEWWPTDKIARQELSQDIKPMKSAAEKPETADPITAFLKFFKEGK